VETKDEGAGARQATKVNLAWHSGIATASHAMDTQHEGQTTVKP
jgi:hypothetical protein